MFMNGAGTGMGLIPAYLLQTPLVRFRGLTACFAVAVGVILRSPHVLCIGATTGRTIGMTATVFVLPALEVQGAVSS